MKLKTAIRYQLYDSVRSLLIFYGVIVLLLCGFSAISVSTAGGQVSFGGMDFATIVFLFVAGLNSFKETFRMFVQNGLSRRTLFWSFLAAGILIAAAMTLADGLLGLASRAAMRGLYQSGFQQLFDPDSKLSAMKLLSLEWVWSLTANFMALLLGFFITTLYYRMNRWQKITVSVGVPILVIAILSNYGCKLWIYRLIAPMKQWIAEACPWFSVVNPCWQAVLFGLLAAALAGLSWLLIRRARVTA